MNPEPPCPTTSVTPDPWSRLAAVTPARLALGRAGSALPTAQVLDLALAHARARDSVHATFEPEVLAAALQARGYASIEVESAAPTRDVYLRRPDLGRRLSSRSRQVLERLSASAPDVSVVVADGLSATAIGENATALLGELMPLLGVRGYGSSPIVLARQARVALGDEIGEIIRSKLMIVLIGERPGLSAADSLGAYLTIAPRIGRTDAERNCVSNIRPGGLVATRAAAKIGWLVDRAFALSLTGVSLKDESEGSLTLPGSRPRFAPDPAPREPASTTETGARGASPIIR